MLFCRRILKDILDKVHTISLLLVKKEAYTPEVANEEPIKIIKDKPILLLETNYPRKKLIIQNIGLEPCYIKLGDGISKDDFHFVLAPDTSLAFGNGGSVTLDNWHGEVYAIAEKETKISVLEY